MLTKKLSFWYTLAAGFLMCACGSGGDGAAPSLNHGGARLLLGKTQVPFFDSLVVDVAGDSMELVHFRFDSLESELRLDDLPPGAERRFVIRVYADGGQVVQQGEAVADLPAGEDVSLTVVLVAVAGFLQLEVPLGLDNPLGIASGSLMLSAAGQTDRSLAMTIENGKGIFATGALPLETTFTLRVELRDPNGVVLYNGTRAVRISSLMQNETLELKSTLGGAVLELQLAASEPVQILATLPVSVRRVPQTFGEVIITELLPYPKTSGDEFEFIELYNTTLDTLSLGTCTLGRARTSAGSTSLLPLSTDLVLPPMSFGVLGRDSALFAGFHYQSFVMSNSGQSLVLFCDQLLLDSLSYAQASDTLNPFPLYDGKSLQLPLSNWKKRSLGSSWCAGSDSVRSGSLMILGSPGADASCL